MKWSEIVRGPGVFSGGDIVHTPPLAGCVEIGDNVLVGHFSPVHVKNIWQMPNQKSGANAPGAERRSIPVLCACKEASPVSGAIDSSALTPPCVSAGGQTTAND